MKDSDKLFDVIGVDLSTNKVRIMATDKTKENADAYVVMAVMRRGVDEECFGVVKAGSVKNGDIHSGVLE